MWGWCGHSQGGGTAFGGGGTSLAPHLNLETRAKIRAGASVSSSAKPGEARLPHRPRGFSARRGGQQVSAKRRDRDLGSGQERVATRDAPEPGPWRQPVRPPGHPEYLESPHLSRGGGPALQEAISAGAQGTRGRCGCEPRPAAPAQVGPPGEQPRAFSPPPCVRAPSPEGSGCSGYLGAVYLIITVTALVPAQPFPTLPFQQESEQHCSLSQCRP